MKGEARRRMHERVDAEIEGWSQELERGWFDSKSNKYVLFTTIERRMFFPLKVTFPSSQYRVCPQHEFFGGKRRVDFFVEHRHLSAAQLAVECTSKVYLDKEKARNQDRELSELGVETIRLRDEDINKDNQAPWACAVQVEKAMQDIESRERNKLI